MVQKGFLGGNIVDYKVRFEGWVGIRQTTGLGRGFQQMRTTCGKGRSQREHRVFMKLEKKFHMVRTWGLGEEEGQG